MRYVLQYSVDIEVEEADLNEDEIAAAIEDATGGCVRGIAWQASWNVNDYDHGRKPMYSN